MKNKKKNAKKAADTPFSSHILSRLTAPRHQGFILHTAFLRWSEATSTLYILTCNAFNFKRVPREGAES